MQSRLVVIGAALDICMGYHQLCSVIASPQYQVGSSGGSNDGACALSPKLPFNAAGAISRPPVSLYVKQPLTGMLLSPERFWRGSEAHGMFSFSSAPTARQREGVVQDIIIHRPLLRCSGHVVNH